MVKEKKNLKEIKRKKFFKENLALFIIIGVVLVLGLLVMFISMSGQKAQENLVYGDDVITMHYFHLTTCPHCQKQNEYLPELEAKYPNLKVVKYEMTQASSAQKYKEMAQNYEDLDPNQFPGTPLTIVGEEFNVGFGTAETTGPILESMVEQEQQRINEMWDDSTMTRTIDLRKEQLQNE